MSDTTAIRNPLKAGSSLRSRTGTRSRSGGPSALAAPTPTRPTDAAPAATALARPRNSRRFKRRRGGGLPLAGSTTRRSRSLPAASALPSPAVQAGPARARAASKTGRRRGRTISSPATRTTLSPPSRGFAAGPAPRRAALRARRGRRRGPTACAVACRVFDQPFPEVEVHQREDRAENHDEQCASLPSTPERTSSVSGASTLIG